MKTSHNPPWCPTDLTTPTKQRLKALPRNKLVPLTVRRGRGYVASSRQQTECWTFRRTRQGDDCPSRQATQTSSVQVWRHVFLSWTAHMLRVPSTYPSASVGELCCPLQARRGNYKDLNGISTTDSSWQRKQIKWEETVLRPHAF